MNKSFLKLIEILEEKFEESNKQKLDRYNLLNNKKKKFNSYKELTDHFQIMLNKFKEEKYEKKTDENILDYFEEIKEDVNFGVLLEHNETYIISILIFYNDVCYSDVLIKDFKYFKEAGKYFFQLKLLVKNNNIEFLSKYIMEKM